MNTSEVPSEDYAPRRWNVFSTLAVIIAVEALIVIWYLV